MVQQAFKLEQSCYQEKHYWHMAFLDSFSDVGKPGLFLDCCQKEKDKKYPDGNCVLAKPDVFYLMYFTVYKQMNKLNKLKLIARSKEPIMTFIFITNISPIHLK